MDRSLDAPISIEKLSKIIPNRPEIVTKSTKSDPQEWKIAPRGPSGAPGGSEDENGLKMLIEVCILLRLSPSLVAFGVHGHVRFPTFQMISHVLDLDMRF